MYDLKKAHKLKLIFEILAEHKITAYEIAHNCNLTEAGVSRIIKKVAKNPQERSLNEILNYLEQRIVGTAINEENLAVNESPGIYENLSYQEQYIKCMQDLAICCKEKLDLFVENLKLKKILDENKIKY